MTCLDHIQGVEVDSPSIESILLVSKFLGVFRTDLHGMPPDRDMGFNIELETDTCPIFVTLYRMTPTELR